MRSKGPNPGVARRGITKARLVMMTHHGRSPVILAATLALMLTSATAGNAADQNAPPTGQKSVAQAHRRAMARNSPAKPQPAAAAPEPVAPKPPDWPANDRPTEAAVAWNSKGLRVDATNSSLQQIMKDVATATGAKITGLGADQRIFGTYGPGPARDVISQLLDGSGYNVLMIGDQGQGTPRQVVLSKQPTVPAPAASNNQGSSADDEGSADTEEPPPPTQMPPPQPQPQPAQAPNGFGQPRTPQQILQEMQQRQQQLQQMQQQQRANPQ